MTSINEWIDRKIKDQDINFFKFDEFINFEKVGEGAFGVVNCADWRSGKIKIALKVLTTNAANTQFNDKSRGGDMESSSMLCNML